MSSDTLFFAAKTLNPNHKNNSSSTLVNALAHNRRTGYLTLNVDASRSNLNYTIKGGSEAQIIKAWTQLRGGFTLRKNSPHVCEALVSVHQTSTGIDIKRYFADAVAWLENEFGADNVISADVHLDEAQPHCHILIYPISKTQSGAVWQSPLGKSTKFNDRKNRFYEQVAKLHGIKKPVTLSANERISAAQFVIQQLRRDGDPCVTSTHWQAIRDLIEHNPAPLCLSMGMELEAFKVVKPVKQDSFVEIFTKPQKQVKKSYSTFNADHNKGVKAPEKESTILCSTFSDDSFTSTQTAALSEACLDSHLAPKTAPDIPIIEQRYSLTLEPKNAPAPEPIELTTRERDCDQTTGAGYWDDKGEFINYPSTPMRVNKLAAQQTVSHMLKKLA